MKLRLAIFLNRIKTSIRRKIFVTRAVYFQGKSYEEACKEFNLKYLSELMSKFDVLKRNLNIF